jgi:hypothetical protein
VKRIEEDGIVIEEGGVDVRILVLAIKFPEHWVRPGTLSLGTPES